MFTILLIAVLIGGNASILLYLFYLRRAETMRINELTRILHQIGNGEMDEAASEKDDRFCDLARTINDMSANMQEVLILLWKQNTMSMNVLSRIATTMNTKEKLPADMREKVILQCDEVQKRHDDNRDLLFEFQFFGVNLSTDGKWHHEPQERKQQQGG